MSQPEEAAYEEPQESQDLPVVPAFTPPAAEELAAMLSHYEVDHIIAIGGMGAVYRAKQTDLDRSVAIKLLPPEALQDEESLARFRSEARSMAKLIHPNIPAVYDFGVAHGYCYFVMEFVEGLNLHQIIRSGALTPDRTMELLGQVCDAINFAHTKGIVHGDIKPANIIVDSDGRAKLTDFGLARLVEHEGENWTPMGTPEYAAPELYLRGGRSDYRADLYSVGVLFYEMLKGVPPQGQFPLPSEELGLDGRVDHIIAKCLEHDPENRFKSAAEIAQILDAIRRMPHPPSKRKVVTLANQPGRRRPAPRRGPIQPPPAARTGGSPAPPFRKRQDNRPLIIGIAVIVVLAIIVYLATRGGGSEEKKSSGKTDEPGKIDQPELAVNPPAAPNPFEAGPGDNPPAESTPPAPPPPEETPATTARPPDTPAVAETPGANAGKPSEKELKALAKAKLDEVHGQFKERWQKEMTGRGGMTEAQTALGKQYRTELEKLYTFYMDKADPASALAVRTEEKRFSQSGKAAADAELAAVDRLGDLQKKFRDRFNAAGGAPAPGVGKFKGEYVSALKELEQTLTQAGNQPGASLVKEKAAKAASLSDLSALFQ